MKIIEFILSSSIGLCYSLLFSRYLTRLMEFTHSFVFVFILMINAPYDSQHLCMYYSSRFWNVDAELSYTSDLDLLTRAPRQTTTACP